MENLKKKKKGFTLIELMAVVAIIAILAAVVTPTVNGYITRSKKTSIVAQTRNFITAVQSYNIAAKNPIADTETRTVKQIAEGYTEGSDEVPAIAAIAEMLDSGSYDKIEEMSVTQAFAINSDADAVNNIILGDDDAFSDYIAPADED